MEAGPGTGNLRRAVLPPRAALVYHRRARRSDALLAAAFSAPLAADAAAALQGAQRAAMTEFPHPFAWAAFGLTGVGR